ncbi:hypothetical protein GPALN_005557 [Globodera pallida]|nr:hypothetical protein GPALN_005557 [Globodera pallida]
MKRERRSTDGPGGSNEIVEKGGKTTKEARECAAGRVCRQRKGQKNKAPQTGSDLFTFSVSLLLQLSAWQQPTHFLGGARRTLSNFLPENATAGKETTARGRAKAKAAKPTKPTNVARGGGGCFDLPLVPKLAIKVVVCWFESFGPFNSAKSLRCDCDITQHMWGK